MPDFGNSKTQFFTQTKSHLSDTDPQDLIIFTNLKKYISLNINMSNLVNDTTVEVFEKTDGTNYRLMSTKIYPTDYDTGIDIITAFLDGVGQDMKVTLTSAVLEGSSKNVVVTSREKKREESDPSVSPNSRPKLAGSDTHNAVLGGTNTISSVISGDTFTIGAITNINTNDTVLDNTEQIIDTLNISVTSALNSVCVNSISTMGDNASKSVTFRIRVTDVNGLEVVAATSETSGDNLITLQGRVINIDPSITKMVLTQQKNTAGDQQVRKSILNDQIFGTVVQSADSHNATLDGENTQRAHEDSILP